jgi:hypothetical protein
MPPRRDRPDDAVDAVDAELVPADRTPPTRRTASPEPPVVARLIVEIRSDGSRTIARGAMEDPTTGKKVAIEARGDSPLALAVSLARSLFTVPALARSAARALLRGRRDG